MVNIVPIPKIILSSNVQSVFIKTDLEVVNVKILSNGQAIFENSFYPYNKTVAINNVNSILEAELKALDSALGDFKIIAYGSSLAVDDPNYSVIEFSCIFCNKIHLGYDNAFLQNFFLTSANARRIADDKVIFLNWIAQDNESLMYYIHCDFYSMGIRKQHSFLEKESAVANGFMLTNLFIAVENIIAKLNDIYEQVNLMCFSVQCGKRQASFFIDNSLKKELLFYFKNEFNVVDSFNFHAQVTKKTICDAELASLGLKSAKYDVNNSVEYEVNSAYLLSDEWAVAESMLLSDDVRQMAWDWDADFDAMTKIVISKSTIENVDNNEKPNQVKFTFQQEINKPAFAFDRQRVFNNVYNITFR